MWQMNQKSGKNPLHNCKGKKVTAIVYVITHVIVQVTVHIIINVVETFDM